MEERLILTAVLLAACVASLVYRSALGRDRGRFAASIAVALAAGAALQAQHLAVTAATVAAFLALIIAPQPLARLAMGGGPVATAAAAVLPLVWWGRGGPAVKTASGAKALALAGQYDEATALLDRVDVRQVPRAARAALGTARASIALHRRDWNGVLHLADSLAPPGDPVQLLAARAAAELGRPAEALQRAARAVSAAPGTWDPLAVTVAELAAIAAAGDRARLEETLGTPEARSLEATLPGTADYWRGRCLLSQGAAEEARDTLERSLGSMPSSRARARSAVQRVIDGSVRHIPAVTLEGYEAARRTFDDLLVAMRPWARFIGGRGPTPVTWAIVLLSAALLAPLYAGGEALWSRMLEAWANTGEHVLVGREGWRLVTALFLHANIFHLGFNAAALLLFGGPVERLWGPVAMASLFLLTGMLGHLTSAMWHGVGSRSVGASTGVYGIVAVYIIALLQLPGEALRRYRHRRAFLLLTVVGFDVLFSLAEPRIDTAGHVGGFVAGILVAGVGFVARRLRVAEQDADGGAGVPPEV